MFQVSSYKSETVEAAQKMEMVLQYQADHTRLIRHLFQLFQDGETYGVGALRTLWRTKHQKRTIWRQQPNFGFFNIQLGGKKVKVRENRTVYEGNEIGAIDPYMFFPDPRVPMAEVNEKGEYVFWRTFQGKHLLKRQELEGGLNWVDWAGQLPGPTSGISTGEESARALISGGRANPGNWNAAESGHRTGGVEYAQVDQGSVDIIPAELGLSRSERPEKWIFTILNKKIVAQAAPLDLDHDRHPVVVSEPYTMGYGFGHPGIADYLGDTQDTVSWFINSHIQNVRTALNNMWLYDPSKVEEQDLKKPGPGKLIRLKRAAFGQDVRQAVQQLPVADVTRGHIQDLELFMRLGDALSAVTDNIRGLQDSGGRKTATEVRTSGEAAASRLAAHTRLISAQAGTDLTEMMSLNTQQMLSEAFYLSIVGRDGQQVPLRIDPEHVVGDFYYPVHDGTLPLDRVAMLDVWKELFLGIASDPELRQGYDMPKIFDFIAELGGARNLDSFKLNIQPNAAVAAQAQAGNVVPLGGPGASGQINAQPNPPAARAAGGP
jgi:hypothetical protein